MAHEMDEAAAEIQHAAADFLMVKRTSESDLKAKEDEAASIIQKAASMKLKKGEAAAPAGNFMDSVVGFFSQRVAGPAAALMKMTTGRYNTLRESPAGAEFKLCVVQFKVPGAKNGGSDKGPDGNRIDSIPIANSVIAAGGACDLILFDSEKNKTDVVEFTELTAKYDALIVRINPGQLSQGTADGTQARFDDLMNKYISEGKLVWSSPKIQTQMGAKDALVNIGNLNCGLTDTFAYYTEKELIAGFKKTCAFQPRVIKQNRGSAGEGIWLCWLWDKAADKKIEIYPSATFGAKSLGDTDYLKLMEMNDNHVEYHTVKEFMTFCVGGPTAKVRANGSRPSLASTSRAARRRAASSSTSAFLPRIDEGEVRILMAGDTCQMAIHKKPLGGGLSAVGGNSAYTYYKPTDAKYKDLVEKLYADIPTLLPSLGLAGEPLPSSGRATTFPRIRTTGRRARTIARARTRRPSTRSASSTARASASRSSRPCAAASRPSLTSLTRTTLTRVS